MGKTAGSYLFAFAILLPLAGCSSERQKSDPDPSAPLLTDPNGSSPYYLALSGRSAPAARSGQTAVWDGNAMLVFGGLDSSGARLGDAKLFDPKFNVWLPIADTDAPAARSAHTAVQTSAGMMVWGGQIEDFVSGGGVPTDTGAYLGPIDNRWHRLTQTGAPSARSGHVAVSTGSQMLVWGGLSATGDEQTGAIYDPLADGWTATNLTGAPSGRHGCSAVWTGRQMIVFGGVGRHLENTGAAYDPVAKTWRALPTAGAPRARAFHSAVFSHGTMVVWGGQSRDGDDHDVYDQDGGVFDVTTWSWSPLPTANAPAGRTGQSAVASDALGLIVYGGHSDTQVFGDGGLLRWATGQWEALPARAADPRSDHSAVWTGSEMIVFGGLAGSGKTLASGFLYTPSGVLQ